MPDYRRYRVSGGSYFFTVNLLERSPYDLLVRHVGLLRSVVKDVRATCNLKVINALWVNALS